MPRDMFGDVVDPSIKLGSQKWYTVPLSIVAHVAIFAAVIIIPLMAPDVLPTPPSMMAFVGGPPAAAAPTPAAAGRGRAQPKVQPVTVNPNAAPVEAPRKSYLKRRPSASTAGVPGGVEGGIPGGTVGGVVGGLPEAPRRRRRPPPRRCASAAISRRRPRPRTSAPLSADRAVRARFRAS